MGYVFLTVKGTEFPTLSLPTRLEVKYKDIIDDVIDDMLLKKKESVPTIPTAPKQEKNVNKKKKILKKETKKEKEKKIEHSLQANVEKIVCFEPAKKPKPAPPSKSNNDPVRKKKVYKEKKVKKTKKPHIVSSNKMNKKKHHNKRHDVRSYDHRKNVRSNKKGKIPQD